MLSGLDKGVLDVAKTWWHTIFHSGWYRLLLTDVIFEIRFQSFTLYCWFEVIIPFMRLSTEIFKVLSIIYHYSVTGIIGNPRPFLCFVTTKYWYGAVVSESSSGALALCQLYKKGIHSSRPSSLWVLHLLTQFFFSVSAGSSLVVIAPLDTCYHRYVALCARLSIFTGGPRVSRKFTSFTSIRVTVFHVWEMW